MSNKEVSHRFHVERIYVNLQSNKYLNVNYTGQQIKEALIAFRGLGVFYNPNKYLEMGFQNVFISLRGTIPINYKGVVYNIPIIIYIARDFPYVSPLVFVDPQDNMFVNVSDQVTPSGQVLYQQQWMPESSSLVTLCVHLHEMFSTTVPLYSKGRSSDTARYDDVVRVSLISAVSETLTRFKIPLESDLKVSLSSLESRRQQLISRQSILRDVIKEMETDLTHLLSQKEIITTHLDPQNDPSLLDLYRPTFPLHKQIFTLMCRESAIEDAIYYLGEALKKGTIQLDAYLRYVRDLSRNRFKLVATIIEGKNNL